MQPQPPTNPYYDQSGAGGDATGPGFTYGGFSQTSAPPSYTEATKKDGLNAGNAPRPIYNQPQYPPPNPYNQQPIPPPGPAPIPHTTVIINQPLRLGPNPTSTVCPYCTQPIVTQTVHTAGSYACFVAAILCIFGLGLCAICALMMPDCQDVTHTCPSCKRNLGTFKRM